jgi:hypothetical protein
MDRSGNSRDTSGTSSDASLPLGRKRCRWPGPGHGCLAGGYPPCSEDMAMRLSSRFLSSLAVAVSSFAVLTFGLNTAAMAATDPSGSSPLPSITVQAPKPLVRPHRTAPRAVARPAARRTLSRETAPAATTQPGGEGTVLERLHRLERTSSNCNDGCESSFPKGNRPWVGCSVSALPMPSAGCRNPRHFTSYVQCTDHVVFLAWQRREAWWYCSNLALNK